MLRHSRSAGLLLARLLSSSGPAQQTAAHQCLVAVAHQHHPHLLRVAARQLTTCSSAAALSLHQLSSSCTLLGPATPFQLGIAARFLSSSAPQDGSKQQPPKEEAFDSLELTEEKMHAITDKIPQKPVTVMEGTSYMVVILGAFAVLGFFVYNFLTNFVFEPTYQACFNSTLQKLKLDPRITVRLGNDIVGYGQESASRVQRQQIPHQLYKDSNGVEHVRLQFNMRGPGGVAIVNADMFKDAAGHWDYTYLIVDVKSGASPPQRLNIVAPKLAPAVV